ncbi:MAG: substrate-binding domain-containing protein [Lachnospiraceae bacterium]|nr:substrate-binding domain-containing protein [Lachnospiraceae bacterium]
MRSKRLVCIISVIMSALLFCGCAAENTTVEEEEPKEEKITIGFSFDSFLIERWEKDRDVFVTTAREAGVEVNVQNANGDVKTQLEQIGYFIEKKVDAIVVVAIDSGRLRGVVAEAKAAGIPVIAYDRMLKDSDADLYISFDNESVGTLMAKALVNEGHTKKALMLSGPLEDSNVTDVNKGFTNVCRKYGITVTDTFYAPNWTPESAADYLRANPTKIDEADAIMCGNDNIATQVVRVLAEHRKAGTVLVTGQDADLEACQRIVQGTQLMTVYKPVEKEAKAAADAAVSLIEGKEPRGVNKTVSDGTYDIPAIILDPIAVDKNNIDSTIIASGFHRKDEVYLYSPQ